MVPDAFSHRPDELSRHNVNNLLPEYSTSIGPHDWVPPPPSMGSCTPTETKEYVLGAALARL